MSHDIQAVFFDIGGTLRTSTKDPAFLAQARRKLAALLGVTEDPEAFYAKLKQRYDAYRDLSLERSMDYPEIELWCQFLLPDFDGAFVAAHAQELTTLWRNGTNGRRESRFDAVETVRELHRRGYKLGIIANTITEAEIPDWAVEEGIAHLFTTVILSSKVRMRKPDPAIYHLACRCIGVPEEGCAYVGDNVKRDVEGTYAAGFGAMILMDDPQKGKTEENRAHCDHLVENLTDLLDLFPPRT